MNFKSIYKNFGFTLVEMMVVIAIISIVATASIGAIRSAQKQARSTKCAANLSSLFKATMAYQADMGFYPAAGGYETYNEEFREKFYYQKRGWVNWVRSDNAISRRGSEANPYKTKNGNRGERRNDSSMANKYLYVGTGCGSGDYNGAVNNSHKGDDINKSRIFRSIDEGAIFKYTGKNMSIYCCDEYKDQEGAHAMRSYAMNCIFGSRRRNLDELVGTISQNATRLVLFVEVPEKNSNPINGKVGVDGKSTQGKPPTDYFTDDSVWDWDKNEPIGLWHKKGGKGYGHVVFADGHVESVTYTESNCKSLMEELGSGE